jgi:hypothetical protein
MALNSIIITKKKEKKKKHYFNGSINWANSDGLSLEVEVSCISKGGITPIRLLL